MKKILSLLFIIVTCISLTSCGSSSEAGMRQENLSPTVNDILDEKTSESDSGSSPAAEPEKDTSEATSDGTASETGKIDIDLTVLNATMVYSQVYDMVVYPENYLGQTVKMNGQFAIYEGEERNYYACLIADATECCQQGIEFVLVGDPVYPDEYPELGTEITVTGVFDMYTEIMGGQEVRYIQLIDAKMLSPVM